MARHNTSVVRFEITPRSIVLILATVAGVWLAYELRIVELILVVALILAGTFNPVIESLERRGLRRGYALAVFVLALVGATACLLLLTVPALIGQLAQMADHAPAVRARVIGLLSENRFTLPLAHAVQGTGVDQTLATAETYVLGYSPQAVRLVGYGVTALVLAFYLIADATRMKGVAYALVPRVYHLRLARIFQNMEAIVGGYMRGQLITSAAIGLFTFLLLLICHVPNALALALFAAIVDVIPFIGGLLVVIPAVLSALPIGLPVAGVVLAALVVYMEFESRILVPKVYGKALRLSPTVVILALLAGGTLMGVLGALLALPIAAGLLMILEELRIELPGDDSTDQAERARDAKAEALYEQLSTGTTASEAGEIASELAQDIKPGTPPA